MESLLRENYLLTQVLTYTVGIVNHPSDTDGSATRCMHRSMQKENKRQPIQVQDFADLYRVRARCPFDFCGTCSTVCSIILYGEGAVSPFVSTWSVL